MILNEVNSSNPAYLRGFAEIAGQKAQLIISNPSGIQVTGARFINTQSLLLTTGKPQLQKGNLESYRVTSGQESVKEGSASRTQVLKSSAKASVSIRPITLLNVSCEGIP